MAYKIDVSIIVRNHLKTLTNDNKNAKRDYRDIIIFGVVPIVTSWGLIIKDIFISKDLVGAIISGLAVYVGLSLNLIILLFEIVQKKETSPFKKDFAKDFIANVCFSVLLSIAVIFSVLLTLIGDPKNPSEHWILTLTNGICFFMLIHMLLLVLMLIKRLYYQLIEQVG